MMMDSSSYGRPPDSVSARLMAERDRVDPGLVQVHKTIQEEIERRSGFREPEYIEIDLEKNMKLSKKVLVPLHRNPGFNYVGKLMGPGGNTLKKLQEKNNVKLHVLGRGSSKDKNKEQELLLSGEPKYSHYAENLHVRIDVLAPPVEAFRRMADALEDIKAHFNTDLEDEISKAQKEEGFVPKEPKVTNFRSGGGSGYGRGGGDDDGSRSRGRGGGGFRGRGSRGMTSGGRGGYMGMQSRPPAAPPVASDYGVGDYNSQPTSGYYNASFNDQYGQSHSQQSTNMPYGSPVAPPRPSYNPPMRPPAVSNMAVGGGGQMAPLPRQPMGVGGGSYSMMGGGQNGSHQMQMSGVAGGGGKMQPAGGQMYGAGGYRMHPYGGGGGAARNTSSYE